MPPSHQVETRFVRNADGILVPVGSGPPRAAPPSLRPDRPADRPVMRKVYLCPTCKIRFPCPEPDPSVSFKGNFSCHVLYNHLRHEVETEMGSDDLEVCPNEECEYNIVQLREDGVPDAEAFLIKHYVEKHLDLLIPLLQYHPLYAPETCLKTISVVKPNTGPAQAPKSVGIPNNKLKPIFTDKFFKFSRSTARCEDPAQCPPDQIVIFLAQWTSRRNYSVAGIRTLVHWISEVHAGLDNKPLYHHSRMVEFVKLMEERIASGQAGPVTVKAAEPVSTVYSPVITTQSELSKATRCRFCNDKFTHGTKLLYHMLHLHKANPVHFICKYLRSKPVTCAQCSIPCMSPVIYALHQDLHEREVECPTCSKKYTSAVHLYTDDMCGDNAIPKNVKMYVNNTLQRLLELEEDTEIIGENFGLHYTKYAKRPLMNDLPMDYRIPPIRKSPEKPKKRKSKSPRSVGEDYIPRTVEEWVINIPAMLDARVAISMVDREEADWALDDQEEEEGPQPKRARLEDEYAFTDTTKAQFRCTKCEAGFAAAHELSVHMRTRHSQKRHLCAVCNKRFATVTDLQQHNLVHTMAADSTSPIKPHATSSYKPSPKSRRVRPSLDIYDESLISRSRDPTPVVQEQFYMCEDCDGCESGCSHEDHSVTLRRGSCADHALQTNHQRARDPNQIRTQTDCRIQLMSLTYSTVYGNKIRKLWKMLAKADMLTNNSYHFTTPTHCKVKDCEHYSTTAMDMFRHVREQHLTIIKKLKIKIGEPPRPQGRKPGPRSRTKPALSCDNPLAMMVSCDAPDGGQIPSF